MTIMNFGLNFVIVASSTSICQRELASAIVRILMPCTSVCPSIAIPKLKLIICKIKILGEEQIKAIVFKIVDFHSEFKVLEVLRF